VRIPFYKYHGAGNDFILIDNRDIKWRPDQPIVAFLCDRHYGIGADGLILLTESAGFDFGMIYFNSDGNESTMCGNGGRCITQFANFIGIIDDKARFNAKDGEHFAVIPGFQKGVTTVQLKMKDVVVGEPDHGDYFIDTGSPHYVIFKSSVSELDVITEARKIRYNTLFSKDGTNVDFVEIRENHLFVRSYERGVEDETLSCGTGITASALATAVKIPDNPGYFDVKAPGGDLKVSFTQNGRNFTDVWLEGPVQFVFRGEIEI
jgi:diaminopimelate epimerase